MAECIVCGAPTSAATVMCEACTRAAAERDSEPEAIEPPSPPPTDRELLEHIAALVKGQQEDIAKIRWRTGCLFAWLLLSVLLGILVLLARSR
jgi:hypothetical protein